jgi:death on curing protein
MEICFLSIEEVLFIHDHQLALYGGMHGLRDIGLLASAINYPQAGFNNKYLHSDVYQMGASYMYAVIKNHPFIDGNKRTGLSAALLFLGYNDIFIDASDDELFELTLAVAQSKVTELDIALFFKQRLQKN